MAVSTKKSVKKTSKATEVKTIEQMQTELIAKQSDLVESKRGHKAGELTNPRAITTTRKQIARLHTAIRAAGIADYKGDK